MERVREAVVCHSLNWSPDLRETFVSRLSHSTFLQHVIADIAEDLKLLNASQGVGTVTIFHDFEHVCFGSDHRVFPFGMNQL